MTTILTQRATPGRIRRMLARGSLMPAAMFLLAACSLNDLLNVRDPDIVTPDNLNDSTALPTVRASAIGDFAQAYSGGSGGEGVIMTSGLLSDELINSETFPTRIEVDRRGPILEDNASAQGWFRTLSRARRAAEFAVEKYRALHPDTTRAPGLSEVLSLAGFGYIFFAENYCSGVPISNALPTGELVYGRPLTTTELLDTAIARFDAAIAAANALTAANPTLLNLARVGRARAQLDRGDFAGAAATVTTVVPTSFVYFVQHTENTPREYNGVYQWNEINERYSLGDREGNYGASACLGGATSCLGSGVGMPFRSVADPRTPFSRTPGTDVGFDGQTPQFDNRRYADRRNFVPLATGAEARLIEAENFLRLGDVANWLAQHNALRAAPPAYFAPTGGTIAPLPALADPGTVAAREDLHFSERARWLWLTAHRLSDMRRLVRQYGRPVDGPTGVFPSGAYFKQSFTYGPDVNFPVPVDERNNTTEPLPPAPMCIDRNP